MNTTRTVVAVAIIAALVASACTATSADSTTTTKSLPSDLPALEFGNGVLPITVPSNFPMPEPSAITTTMIDGSRELTEVAFNVGGSIEDVTAFYVTNLPALGYQSSETSDASGNVSVTFVGHGIDGAVMLKVAGQGITSGTLVFVYSS